MIKRQLNIVHLYPKDMNIYGDNGNVLTLVYRAHKFGVETKLEFCNVGDKLKSDTDIIVGGGGQDRGQFMVQADLQMRSKQIKDLLGGGVVCLAVCGMYQLLGHEFITADGSNIRGIGYFDMTTRAGSRRLVGNVIVESEYGQIVGFENHSGQTFLGDSLAPLGKVKKGFGNNARGKDEGAALNNTFGTYLHGPVLPKNPKFADELIRRALLNKYGSADLNYEHIDDLVADMARLVALKRP